VPDAPEAPLEERRLRLRAQLRTQRENIARQLAGGGYPRSVTMRLLLYRPALVVGLLTMVAGPRIAGRVHAVSIAARALTALAALAPDGHSLPGVPVMEA
jgi:hypothetical protein